MNKSGQGIAVLGVAPLGFGLYTDDNLWTFLVGMLLMADCALADRKMGAYLRALLEWP